MTDTTNPPNPTCLILDVATSGLSPEKATILEVSTILVDLRTLDVLDTYQGVIHHPPDILHGVPEFHGGLVRECKDPERPRMAGVEGFLLAGPWTNAGMLLNRNLWFDLKFLRRHMPTLAKSLPSRQVDMNDLAWLYQARGAKPYEPTPRTFRASDDAISVYAELTHYMGGVAGNTLEAS